MLALFSALAEVEEQQPYLPDSAVRRGTRGLAEYHLGSYGPAWNRYCRAGLEGCFSILQTPVSLLLLLLLSRSFLVITSPPKAGSSIGSSLSSQTSQPSP